ncbi:hypothetical protein FA10DRAFT_164285 [Acaromyces ingoldii]|uniref:MT-A70-domain-containing protein n=1 Tax=Acaromyces ingoldii TaxID=215250 RepID=A0A316YH56_9BASI|nr:hypothetical protein FA10DRAFT_164285 [Acaromyces ingoldii]PWN88481.1 hypothetical protein FA10DRAFT_164285 [Acaromyces ingoldii]
MGDDEDDRPRRGNLLFSGSTEVEGHTEVEIHVIDALASLIDALPRVSLSSEPIRKPWDAGGNNHDGEGDSNGDSANTPARKRMKPEQRFGINVDKMVDTAHAELCRAWKGPWLTARSMDKVHVRQDKIGSETTPWADLEAAQSHDETGMIHKFVFNNSEQEYDVDRVTLAPRSGFLITNLLRSQLQLPEGWIGVVEHARQHPASLVLVDPPYPNMSASRLQQGKREAYRTVDDLYDLWKMVPAVETLIGQDTLVGCWVTNHAKVQAFVLEKLFDAWKLQHLGQLVWVKVTSGDAAEGGGQLVVPLQNRAGRKPYEILLLGRRRPSADENKGKEKGAMVHMVAGSVPLDHSRKPDVTGAYVLGPMLPKERPLNVYDIFGRTALRGPVSNSARDQKGVEGHTAGSFVSIGNQACLFNEIV